MDYKLLAQKYIKYGIEWLDGEFDTYKGMTTIMETEENLNREQLEMLCDEIKKDTRVKMAMIDSEYECTIRTWTLNILFYRLWKQNVFKQRRNGISRLSLSQMFYER